MARRRRDLDPTVLSALVSAGVQIASMLFITIFVACLGFLSPSRRGSRPRART
jgi:hypothetical protein